MSLGFERLRDNLWESDDAFIFELQQPITNVEEFGRVLQLYLKGKKLPFHVKKAYLVFKQRRVDKSLRPYWKLGFLIMHIKRRPLSSYFNPWHDEFKGSETVVIGWELGQDFFFTYNEVKEPLVYHWHFTWEQIEEYFKILKDFANKDDVYKLLLRCAKDGS